MRFQNALYPVINTYIHFAHRSRLLNLQITRFFTKKLCRAQKDTRYSYTHNYFFLLYQSYNTLFQRYRMYYMREIVIIPIYCSPSKRTFMSVCVYTYASGVFFLRGRRHHVITSDHYYSVETCVVVVKKTTTL